jgi:phage baseplate assembly protein W
MTTFIGFNTQNQFKKFTLINNELIKRDFLNSLQIRQGQLPGRPDYGTTLWDYVFENLDTTTEQGIINEIQRMVGLDPRIAFTGAVLYPQSNGLLIEVEIQYVTGTTSETLQLFFDQQNNTLLSV